MNNKEIKVTPLCMLHSDSLLGHSLPDQTVHVSAMKAISVADYDELTLTMGTGDKTYIPLVPADIANLLIQHLQWSLKLAQQTIDDGYRSLITQSCSLSKSESIDLRLKMEMEDLNMTSARAFLGRLNSNS